MIFSVGNIIREMILYFGTDIKRINHALKVYGYSKGIAECEKLNKNKLDILEAAAVLHDIGIKESERKYNSSAGNYQEIEGPPIAREMLTRLGYAKSFVDRVCFLIGNHHSYNNIDDIDFQILIEADFLVNVFEDEIKKEQICVVRDKYFKTKAGKEFIEGMYIDVPVQN